MVFTEQQLQVKKLVDVQQDIEIDALNDGVGALSTSMQNGFTEAANNFNDIENSFAAVNTTSNDRYNTLYGAINSLSDAMDNTFLALGNSISNVATNTSDTFNSVNANIANSVTTNLLTANDIYIDTSAAPVNSTAALGYDVNGKIIPITTIVNTNISFPPNADYLYTDSAGTAFAGSFNDFNNNFANIGNQFNDFGNAVQNAFNDYNDSLNGICNTIDNISNDYNNQFNDVSNQFNNINNTFIELDNDLTASFNDYNNQFNDVYNSFNLVDDTFAGVQNQFNDVNNGLNNINYNLSQVNWELESYLAALRQPAMVWVNETARNSVNSIENAETFTGTQAQADASFTVLPKSVASKTTAYIIVNTSAKKAGFREYSSSGVPQEVYPPTWIFADSTSLKNVNYSPIYVDRDIAPKVISAAGMFYNCKNLVGNVPNLYRAPNGYGGFYFNYAYTFFNTGITSANIGYGLNFSHTFDNCKNLVNVSSYDFSRATCMENTFAGCTNLAGTTGGTGLSIKSASNELNYYRSTSLYNTFFGCNNFNVKKISITGAFSSAIYTFRGCKKLNPTNVLLKHMASWYYTGMFENCTNLNPSILTLPEAVSKTKEGSSVNFSSAEDMFRNCTSLNTTITFNGPMDYNNTFADCTSLNQDVYMNFDIPNSRANRSWGFSMFIGTFNNCPLLGTKNLHIPSYIYLDSIDESEMNYLTNGYMGVNWSGRILNDI